MSLLKHKELPIVLFLFNYIDSDDVSLICSVQHSGLGLVNLGPVLVLTVLRYLLDWFALLCFTLLQTPWLLIFLILDVSLWPSCLITIGQGVKDCKL